MVHCNYSSKIMLGFRYYKIKKPNFSMPRKIVEPFQIGISNVKRHVSLRLRGFRKKGQGIGTILANNLLMALPPFSKL